MYVQKHTCACHMHVWVCVNALCWRTTKLWHGCGSGLVTKSPAHLTAALWLSAFMASSVPSIKSWGDSPNFSLYLNNQEVSISNGIEFELPELQIYFLLIRHSFLFEKGGLSKPNKTDEQHISRPDLHKGGLIWSVWQRQNCSSGRYQGPYYCHKLL